MRRFCLIPRSPPFSNNIINKAQRHLLYNCRANVSFNQYVAYHFYLKYIQREKIPQTQNLKIETIFSDKRKKSPEPIGSGDNCSNIGCKSALGELGSAAGGLQTVLLTLLHTRIAGQEASGLQSGTIVLVSQQQGAGNTVTDSAGLAGHAAAGNGSHDVELLDVAGGDQGLANQQLQGLQAELIVDVTTIDGNGASAVGEQVHAGNGGLPTAGAIEIRLLALVHARLPP